jgi:ribosomal protein S18 acetylase RimI-like enzyme
MTNASVVITRGSAANIDQVQPLWLEVHHHHQSVSPHLAPYVDDETSWAERRALYAGLLAKPDTVLLLAHDGDALVGYGLAHVMAAPGSWVADTWLTAPQLGEIETLAVRARWRRAGVGERLLTGLIDALHAAGVDDLVIGVLPTNTAVHLYERHGFRPTWGYLSRFTGR